MEHLTQITYQNRRPMLVRREVVLRVVAGPDKGKLLELGDEPVRVGAAADSDLVLTDEQVSRQHLLLKRTDAGYLTEDLGSTNGTFYRGAQVQEVVLGAGAELRVGSTVIRLEIGDEQSDLIQGQAAFGDLIGVSSAMQRVFGILAAVAPTPTTVLIEGETGTGKELVAEELHNQSPWRDRPFVVVDCASMPAGLIESQLFGHERGAFSGADRAREGALAEADGGTIFFDEIGELPLELQTRLLRVIDKHEVRRVGGTRTRIVNVRVVAATNRDLATEVREGRFRQDLYYRLAVARIELPPLRERVEDIPLLARHFLRRFGCLDPDAVLTEEVTRTLVERPWPGNVRELRNFIERIVLMVDGELALDTFRAAPAGSEVGCRSDDMEWLTRQMPAGFLALPYKQAKEALIGQFDRLYLQRLIDRHGVNIHQLAREARVDRALVRRMLRKRKLVGNDPQ